jgi:hypothetical protein
MTLKKLPPFFPLKNREASSVKADEVPKKYLDDNAGWLKAIIGEYEKFVSAIPNYDKQYLYHVHLDEGKHFILTRRPSFERPRVYR